MRGSAQVGVPIRSGPSSAAFPRDITPANDRCARGNWSPINAHRLGGARMTHDNDGRVKGRRGIRRLTDTSALPNPLRGRPGL
jgi:hypothetical protein